MKREELTFEEQFYIANILSAERLPEINAKLQPVELPDTFYVKYGKRAIDICVSLPLFLITLPINAALGIGTMLDVGRPIFFKQTRIGMGEKPFQLVKFRNMRNTTDENGNLLPAAQRVTKFGSFVRKTSLDELLNFWFVLKGDMSIIGPRPLVEAYTNLYNVRHRSRLKVRPGLECPPHDFETVGRDWHSRFENDAWYVEHISLKTDLMLAGNLVRLVFNKKDAQKRAAGSAGGTFLGYSVDGTAMTLDGISQEEIDRVLSAREAN